MDCLLATTIAALEDVPNSVMASANLALSWFGRLDPQHEAHSFFLERKLITEQGNPIDDILMDALDFEINARTNNGKWM